MTKGAIRTCGLTHVALAVGDAGRAAKFYKAVFGAIEVYRQAEFVQLQTPGTRDVIVLEEADGRGASRGRHDSEAAECCPGEP